nr:hypothetical protein [Nitrosomonas sp. Nm132]
MKNADPNSKPQKPPQKGPQFAPDLHAVTGVIVADDVLFGVIILAHDGQFLHVESRPLEFFDARFCLGVGVVYPNYSAIFSHGFPPCYGLV